ASERQLPPIVKGRRPKIFYATQAAVAPPTFVFFANDAASVHFSYRRYLENRLRDTFGFAGTPLRLVFRDRTAVKLPRRKKASGPGGRRPAAGPPSRPGPAARPWPERGCGARRPSGRGSGPPDAVTAGSGRIYRATHGPARVAVVGARAWGTTLGILLCQHEPVTVWCRSEEYAARIKAARRNEVRLPGVDLPAGVRPT